MGSINVKSKIMPASPETSLENIKEGVRKTLEEKYGVKTVNFEEDPVAFGLKALIILFIWPEDKELESVEEELRNIEGVNSFETLDIRRSL